MMMFSSLFDESDVGSGKDVADLSLNPLSCALTHLLLCATYSSVVLNSNRGTGCNAYNSVFFLVAGVKCNMESVPLSLNLSAAYASGTVNIYLTGLLSAFISFSD